MLGEDLFSPGGNAGVPKGQPAGHYQDMSAQCRVLLEAEITRCQELIRASNSVFLVTLRHGDLTLKAIYKPRLGERPLWDFPRGTLFRREVASYVVSQALKWHLVPPTVIRDGPYGIGAVQLFVVGTPVYEYETLFNKHQSVFLKVAVFDWLVNNADRKIGHCIEGVDGRLWLIDHGITFNEEPKLRTVIWDFGGQKVPREILSDLAVFQQSLDHADSFNKSLNELLSPAEVLAFRERLAQILKHPVFPSFNGSYHTIPWPPY